MYRHIVTPAARALAARAGGVTATCLQAAFGIQKLSSGVYVRAEVTVPGLKRGSVEQFLHAWSKSGFYTL